MNPYSIRPARIKDLPVLIRHRRQMFEAMGAQADFSEMEAALSDWIPGAMEGDIFFAWLAETPEREVVAGGAVTLLPWPPTAEDPTPIRACVYNVWTDPPHRKKGLARKIMETIHDWCQEKGIRTVALHASEEGRPLYASLGYKPTGEMRLRLPQG